MQERFSRKVNVFSVVFFLKATFSSPEEKDVSSDRNFYSSRQQSEKKWNWKLKELHWHFQKVEREVNEKHTQFRFFFNTPHTPTLTPHTPTYTPTCVGGCKWGGVGGWVGVCFKFCFLLLLVPHLIVLVYYLTILTEIPHLLLFFLRIRIFTPYIYIYIYI